MRRSTFRNQAKLTTNPDRRRFLKQGGALLGWLGLHGCGGGGAGTAPGATIPVSIQTHPTDQTVSSGSPASFLVIASGSNLSYQWQRNGVDIPGANQPQYVLSAASLADNGANFRVLVSNAAGTVTSSIATLLVTPAGTPTITQQPADIIVLIGRSATFQTTATGDQPLVYQWRRDGQDIPGATGASYTLPLATLADDGASFSVAVSNALGAVSSRTALLNVVSTGTTIDTTAIRVDTTLITIDEI
ncbi:MAG TPA: hypothetical protein ENK49_00730 [Gammaproteobacteria bacterium]|nr:hypothetical protein [Gammaproteobacteria bacterium]